MKHLIICLMLITSMGLFAQISAYEYLDISLEITQVGSYGVSGILTLHNPTSMTWSRNYGFEVIAEIWVDGIRPDILYGIWSRNVTLEPGQTLEEPVGYSRSVPLSTGYHTAQAHFLDSTFLAGDPVTFFAGIPLSNLRHLTWDLVLTEIDSCSVSGYVTITNNTNLLWYNEEVYEPIAILYVDGPGEFMYFTDPIALQLEPGESISQSVGFTNVVDYTTVPFEPGVHQAQAYYFSTPMSNIVSFEIEPASINEHIQEPLSIGIYPNPFHRGFSIPISTTKSESGVLEIYNIKGQKLVSRTLQLSAGENLITWQGINVDPSKLSTGVYLFRIKAGNHTKTIRCLKMD